MFSSPGANLGGVTRTRAAVTGKDFADRPSPKVTVAVTGPSEVSSYQKSLLAKVVIGFAVLCNVGVTKPAKYEKSARRVGAQLAQRHLHPEKMTAVQGDWSLARAADRSRTRINDQFERRSGLVWNSGPLWIAPFRKTFWLRNRPRI